jgi:hypothetical protein
VFVCCLLLHSLVGANACALVVLNIRAKSKTQTEIGLVGRSKAKRQTSKHGKSEIQKEVEVVNCNLPNAEERSTVIAALRERNVVVLTSTTTKVLS